MILRQLAWAFGFAVSVIGAFVCWLLANIKLIRMVANRKSGVPLFRHLFDNPFNLIFRPDQLTERGLTARNWVFRGSLGCFLFSSIGIIMGVFGTFAVWPSDL